MSIERKAYGTTAAGDEVDLYTLENGNGLRAEITNFGALLTSLVTPDRDGHRADVALGFETLAEWEKNPAYLGATVGRYGNRIANGRFELDGQVYKLACNDGDNHLHGGLVGFDKVVWRADATEVGGDPTLRLEYTSLDNEEGYPGELAVQVEYGLIAGNALRIEFIATTDKPTVINLVHHTYWNLNGDPSQLVLDHELMLHADAYLPVHADGIPTGDRRPVEGTPMDFRAAHVIGDRIDQVDGGYDHNWIPEVAGDVRCVAEVTSPSTGRRMLVETDQPGIQFYSGNFLDGTAIGRGGVQYERHAGLCLETQAWPDSPNRPGFPSSVLRPGETYHHAMVHRFDTV
jgi:aldose 1-epimerase